jgi:release factor H-coupled RctB family protein
LAEYMIEHDYAVQWAVANRDLVAHRIKQCVHGHSIDAGIPLLHELGKIIDVTHNSVTKHTLSIGDQEKTVWVHRKGAAPTDKGIIPCPGSRGDFSWLLEPIGDGRLSGEWW